MLFYCGMEKVSIIKICILKSLNFVNCIQKVWMVVMQLSIMHKHCDINIIKSNTIIMITIVRRRNTFSEVKTRWFGQNVPGQNVLG